MTAYELIGISLADPGKEYLEECYKLQLRRDGTELVQFAFDDLGVIIADPDERKSIEEAARQMMADHKNSQALRPQLADGTWWGTVEEALDELVAGERELKRLLVYSGLSSGLRSGRVHVLTLGESQQGKSFIQEQVATQLFPSISMCASSMSAKAPYGEAQAKNDPHIYDHKIMLIDEFKDLADSTRATIKAITSNGRGRMVNKTLDDRRKYTEQVLEGMPTVWTNSADVFEDLGNQIGNRYLKTNIDESADQSRRVEAFQKERMKFGPLQRQSTVVPLAQAYLAEVLHEVDFDVINLFADGLEQAYHKARNQLPMLHNLVQAITYSRRFERPRLELGESKILFSALSDVEEALQLWEHFSGTQSIGLPDRHRRMLDALVEGEEYNLDDATASYNQMNPNSQIAAGTCRNYLTELSEKNLVTTKRDPEGGRHYKYVKISGVTTTSQIRLWSKYREDPSLLEGAIKELEGRTSQLHNGMQKQLQELKLQERLTDPPRGSKALLPASMPAPSSTGGEDLETRAAGLIKMIRERTVTKKDLEKVHPRQKVLIDKLFEKGIVGAQGDGVLFVR